MVSNRRLSFRRTANFGGSSSVRLPLHRSERSGRVAAALYVPLPGELAKFRICPGHRGTPSRVTTDGRAVPGRPPRDRRPVNHGNVLTLPGPLSNARGGRIEAAPSAGVSTDADVDGLMARIRGNRARARPGRTTPTGPCSAGTGTQANPRTGHIRGKPFGTPRVGQESV